MNRPLPIPDSLDRSFDAAARRSHARVPERGQLTRRLRKLGVGIGAIALAPLLIAAMSAMVLVLLAKLVFALIAVGFER